MTVSVELYEDLKTAVSSACLSEFFCVQHSSALFGTLRHCSTVIVS